MRNSDERRKIERELDLLEQRQKELEIGYEQYFAGVEKREPMQAREELSRRFRRMANRRIVQTDLRFRFQGLASRHQSYGGYWNRILRLMDEGRFVRGGAIGASQAQSPPPDPGDREIDRLHRELTEAHRAAGVEEPAPDRDRLAAFIDRQRQRIREKYGASDLEFRVAVEEGKPKIKVRGKRKENP